LVPAEEGDPPVDVPLVRADCGAAAAAVAVAEPGGPLGGAPFAAPEAGDA
jgi:hypothetical protein